MRRAADVSGDGKVTLNEAYQFAFHETLSTTEETQAGAQHPSYDINLSGTGDVVMTDVRQMPAGLIVGKSLHGSLFIRNADYQLVAEVFKVAGRSLELGLEPGSYDIHFDQKPGKFQANIEIKDGERFGLAPENLFSVDSEKTVSRGDKKKTKELRSVSFGIIDRMDEPYDGIQVSLFGNRSSYTTGTQIASIFNIADGPVSGMQFSIAFNKASGKVGFGQVASIVNFVDGDLKGFQISGVANIINGEADGVQIGVLNLAKTLDGLQLDAQHHSKRAGKPNRNSQLFRGKIPGIPTRSNEPYCGTDGRSADRRRELGKRPRRNPDRRS